MEPKRVEVYPNRAHKAKELLFAGWFICNLYDRSRSDGTSDDNFALVVDAKTGKVHQLNYDSLKFLTAHW